jgi:DNA-binding response OmpR family regulator
MTIPRLNSVLIVEDEGLVCLMLEDLLHDMGALVIDVFATAGDALAALRAAHYDCAILDIIVRDGTSEPVADALAERDIPFLFSSGVDLDVLPPRHQGRRLISKPFDDSTLAAQISDLLRGRPRGLCPA